MNDKLVISGNKKLNGTLNVQGAKNSALPLIAAAIMAEDEVELIDVPKLKDVTTMLEILKRLGCKVVERGNVLLIDNRTLTSVTVPEDLMKEMRSSIVLLGALLAKKNKAMVSYPGGCAIGERPIELHLMNFQRLGCEVEEKENKIIAKAPLGLKGTDIELDYPSVGATENLMMSSVFAQGITNIINPAKEPEIVDLQNFLNAMGAKIEGAGTNNIKIIGVNRLKGTKHRINPDRIVAGTYMIAGAITGGNVTLKNVIPEHVSSLTDKLREAGVNIIEGDRSLTIIAPEKFNKIELIKTSPYPGFPTDLQPQILALCTVLNGSSLIVENIFESRFRHVEELKKMGADIMLGDGIALVRGPTKLTGTKIKASDLRAGASLVIAALGAEGVSVVEGLEHIDRGYEQIENQLRRLGAKVERVKWFEDKYENA
ncbi:UDP-N-acetylglucosamine 1-carboxyvinyltransferase [Natranaerofaba carboxydovora]|uniref:UDP-N-acetylglucosamine 1-carboxyvinyltransferase n=1 Tax=Natranaerofaba carboxydovora TaxID=2742683 RepID=UPI003B84572A